MTLDTVRASSARELKKSLVTAHTGILEAISKGYIVKSGMKNSVLQAQGHARFPFRVPLHVALRVTSEFADACVVDLLSCDISGGMQLYKETNNPLLADIEFEADCEIQTWARPALSTGAPPWVQDESRVSWFAGVILLDFLQVLLGVKPQKAKPCKTSFSRFTLSGAVLQRFGDGPARVTA